MKDLYEKTLKISNEIIKKFKLLEIWECESNKIEIKKFKKTYRSDFIAPLNQREAFYGGRTNATKLRYSCRKLEKMRYIDVCSLYPTV
jgi:hypothetical protein